MDIYNGRTFGGLDSKTEIKKAEQMTNTSTTKTINTIKNTNNKKEQISVAEEVAILLNKKFKK